MHQKSDVETQLFYCNSRYYSPELCRFIQPVEVASLNTSNINELNLYSYCGNNPNRIFIKRIESDFLDSEMSSSVNTNVICEDFKFFLGWYMGVPIFQNPFSFVGRSYSFGAIFLAERDYIYYCEEYSLVENTLKHEWGHVIQFLLLNPLSYFLYIGIPSMLQLGKRKYYLKPWEITAEYFGNVKSEKYEYKREDYIRGFAYLAVAMSLGPIAYLFLLGEYNIE